MANLTKKQRDALPESAFGDPANRLFPITDQEDVDSAARLIGKAKNPDAVKRRIIAIAKRKGLKIPDAWTSDGSMSAAFSDDRVVRRGKLFEAGDYPDKRFSISPEEMQAAVADFSPVPIDLEHRQTVLSGKLGHLTSVDIGADPFELYGDIEIPRALDALLGADEVKASVRWDPDTKRLHSLALVIDPRIPDAEVSSAFSRCQGDPDVVFHDVRGFAQKVHDLGSSAGAACMPTASFSDRKERRMSFKDTLKAWFSAGMPDEFEAPTAPTPQPAPQQPTPVPTPQPDPETDALRQKVAAFEQREQERIAADAATFARGEVDAKRILPAAEAEAKERYLRAAKDDAALGTVTFSTGPTTRVAQLRADYAARTPHGLTDERLAAAATPGQVLFNRETTPHAGAEQPPTPEALKALLEMSTLGRAVNGAQHT